MNNCLLTKTAVALCLTASFGASAADYTPWNPFATHSERKISSHKAATNLFEPKSLENGIMLPDLVQEVPYHRVTDTAGIIFAPDGSDWFYTLELDGVKTVDNPYYTEYDYTTFHVKVYDANFNFIGQAKGEVERPEGTLKCQSIMVGEFLSTNFFNSSSSDIEITITSNFNPAPVDGVFRYGAKQTTEAYTLTQELPVEGLSKPLFQAPGYIISKVNAGSAASENYVIALAEETSWDGEDINTGNYVIYKKAGWGTPASEVTRFVSDLSLSYSDGYNEAAPCVMTAKGSDVYIATSAYEKSFIGGDLEEDPTLTADNNYIITLFKSSGNKYEEIGKTVIPCTAPEDENYRFRSYALGNFSGSADITFDFGNGETPCYIISVVDSGTTDETSAYYAIYDTDGNEIKRFGNGSDGYVYFWDLPGHPTQYGFDMESKDGDYGTVLINYPSLEEVGFVPKLFEYDGEIWSVISVPDRTIADGQVLYAASARASNEATENIADYVAWFTADGSLHHLDTLDFGSDAAKVLTNIQGSVLNPYLFNTDSEYEYLAWVYRYIPGGNGTTLELAVCDGKGNVLATRKIGDNSSIAGAFAYVANTGTNASIMVTYRTLYENRNWYVKQELIKLPLNNFDGEGTAESPYLIKTYGDLDQVRNNLTSHFRLANSIDCEGHSFRPIEGAFTGTFDGNNYSISNLTIASDKSGAAFFSNFGANVPYGEEPVIAVMKNVTFINPSLSYTGNTLGVKDLGIVSANAYNAVMHNVYVAAPVFREDETSVLNARFGVLASMGKNLTVKSCGVKGADIFIPRSGGLGGLVYEARDCSFSACYFNGSLSGRSNVGGITGMTLITPSTFTDCHVNASISGESNVGGILASSNRSIIKRCVVQGSIKADESVGGIAGFLATLEDTDETIVIEDCVVALSSFSVPENAEAAHRIVGYTSIDDGETYEYIPDPDDPENNMTVVPVPAAPEQYIGKNYVTTSIPAVEEGNLATEGTTQSAAKVNMDWYVELGYRMGSTTTAPWTMKYMDKVPALYFEANIGKSMEFVPSEMTGKPGEILTATLVFNGIDDFVDAIESGFVELSSTSEAIAYFNGYGDMNDDMTEFYPQIALGAEGTATLSITYRNSITALLTVTVINQSGISDVTIDNVITYMGSVITADGCAIELYDLQGRRVAAGNDTLATDNLAGGIYVVRATDANGKNNVLKISVR